MGVGMGVGVHGCSSHGSGLVVGQVGHLQSRQGLGVAGLHQGQALRLLTLRRDRLHHTGVGEVNGQRRVVASRYAYRNQALGSVRSAGRFTLTWLALFVSALL